MPQQKPVTQFACKTWMYVAQTAVAGFFALLGLLSGPRHGRTMTLATLAPGPAPAPGLPPVPIAYPIPIQEACSHCLSILTIMQAAR